jgi:hypothetical protein
MPAPTGNVSRAGRYDAADPRRDSLPMNNGLIELTDATFEEEVNGSD